MKLILCLILGLGGGWAHAEPLNPVLADFAGRNPVQSQPGRQDPEVSSKISIVQKYLSIVIPLLLVAGLVFGISGMRHKKNEELRRRRGGGPG